MAECGRFPLYIETYKRTLNYWLKILSMSNQRYVKKCYVFQINQMSLGKCNWASRIRDILYRHGFGFVWENQTVWNKHLFISKFVERLKDEYLQDLFSSVRNNRKLSLYNLMKTNNFSEHYIDMLDIRVYLHLHLSESVHMSLKLKRVDILALTDNTEYVHYVTMV